MDYLHKKQFVIWFMMISLFCSIALCTFLSWNEMRIKKVSVDEIQRIDSRAGAEVHLEDAYFDLNLDGYDGSEIMIKGWCIIKGKRTNPVSIHVCLQNIETNDYIILPTIVQTREDVTTYLNDGVNYDNSGFKVHMRADKLKLESKKYEINILYQIGQEKYLISSGQFLSCKED